MIKDIGVKETRIKGKGVFAKRNFSKGEFIFRGMKGKVVTRKQIPGLTKDERNHLNQIGRGLFEVQKSPERYINHSCDPNAIAKSRSFYALRKIKKGEEITSDYRISALDEGWVLNCLCGSEKCRGKVRGDFFDLSPKLQKKYLRYAPGFIREEYKKRHQKS